MLYPNSGLSDGLVSSLKNINRIDIKNSNKQKIIKFYLTDKTISIIVDNHNRIISYIGENVKKLDDNFMKYNYSLKNIVAPQLINIGKNCLQYNKSISELYLQSVEFVDENFMYFNDSVDRISMESLQYIGDYFMNNNGNIKYFNSPNLLNIGNKTFCNRDYNSIKSLKLVSKLYLITMRNKLRFRIVNMKTK